MWKDTARISLVLALLPAQSTAAFAGTAWKAVFSVGRESTTDSMLTPPLAMFSQGGGKATTPAWYDQGWAASGARLILTLDLRFDGAIARLDDQDVFGKSCFAPARQLHAGSASFASMTGLQEVPTRGVAWSTMDISSVEKLLVYSLTLPDGASKGDVSVPAGSLVYGSARVWKRSEADALSATLPDLEAEVQRELETTQRLSEGFALKERIDKRRKLEARIERLRRGLPCEGTRTVEVAAPLSGGSAADAELIVARDGQLSVRQLIAGRFPNPFGPNTAEHYGVIGYHCMDPLQT